MSDTRVVLWLGLYVGLLAAEVAWRVLAPIAAAPRSPTPPLRLVLALSAIFSGGIVLFLISRQPSFSGIPRRVWEHGLLLWVASPLWFSFKKIQAITSGKARRTIQIGAAALNALISLLVVVGFVDCIAAALQSMSGVSLALAALGAIALATVILRWFRPAIAGAA